MISIYTGKPGAGKSLKLADTLLEILNRNSKWFEKCKKEWESKGGVPPEKRLVYSNLKIKGEIEEFYKEYIRYWEDPRELTKFKDADVFWDEIATHLDSTRWKECSLELKRWLQQHRKFGIEIYGTTQDFAMIDIAMRRLTSDVQILYKICGSRDPSPTTPPIKKIWGLIMIREAQPETYAVDKMENNAKILAMPSFMFLTRERVETFDTRQEIRAGKQPMLEHIARFCPICNHEKISHA